MQNKIREIRERVESELRIRYPKTLNFDRKQIAPIIGCTVGHISNCKNAGKSLIDDIPKTPGSRDVVYPFNIVVDYLVEQQGKRLKPRLGRPTKKSKIEGDAA